MKPLTTLYCIADEAGFRLLHGQGSDIHEMLGARSSDFEDVEHAFSGTGGNHSGRGGDISFGHASASKAEIERPRLARHVITALQAEWAKGGHDRIVLAAGPKMLGALRDAMPDALAAHVTDLAKDLSDVPAQELYPHFKGMTQV